MCSGVLLRVSRTCTVELPPSNSTLSTTALQAGSPAGSSRRLRPISIASGRTKAVAVWPNASVPTACAHSAMPLAVRSCTCAALSCSTWPSKRLLLPTNPATNAVVGW